MAVLDHQPLAGSKLDITGLGKPNLVSWQAQAYALVTPVMLRSCSFRYWASALTICTAVTSSIRSNSLPACNAAQTYYVTPVQCPHHHSRCHC